MPLVDKKLDYQINQTYPIVNYNSDLVKYLLENKVIQLKNVYNKPQYVTDVSSKVKFHEIMMDSKFVPETVFSKEKAMNLKFPVIAKPDNNHSGMGIQIFKNKMELEKSKDNFDVFSECKKIKEEFRLIFFKEQPILFMKREPLNKKAKEGDGTTDEAMVFTYRRMMINYVPEEFGDVLKEVRKKFENVDFYALDIMEDEEGAVYIIEINSQPGLPFDSTVMMYKAIYNDFYKTKLSQRGEYDLSIFASDLDMMTVQNSNNRFLIGN
jgi:glutathione synthase/RimK-type ligase-like ATP-grasp enzyme